jgi:exopolysaccharide biosynthesis WecB/TagA/CpsF family protein
LNLYSVYLFKKEDTFRNSVSSKKVYNFLDGGVPSLFLSVINLRKTPRLRGPTFTRKFLESNIPKKSKIMFVGNCSNKDLDKISQDFKIPRKNLFNYEKLPYIAPKIEFDRADIFKLSKEIKSKKIDYCFVCVGNPRQEILSYELSKIIKNTKFLSVGAALDFILERKKEAPKIVRELYLEWLYRLITDFKYSKKKVMCSIIGLWYLVSGKVKIITN